MPANHVSSVCRIVVAEPVYALGEAISLSWEKAVRVGELCRGEEWDPRVHLSRQTIGAALDAESIGRFECILLQPPRRKTHASSAVAREKCNKPWVVDAQARTPSAFAVWGARLQRYDPVPRKEWPSTSAFRFVGPLCLARRQVCLMLKTVAQECAGDFPNWEDFDYGLQSLQIGRINAWRATGSDIELVLAGSTHTSTAGLEPYARAEVTAMLSMDWKAETAKVTLVETVHRFDEDRSKPQNAVYMVDDGKGELRPMVQSSALAGLVC